ncbi:hypothetical protein [Candidatus Tisiphia endosymbiont of Parasteatoda lunata]|uniref:hypothetical protein n=1 Tax=Candidatus Tisiphia endosymbiont of Parasteatoda lunata TaxID=3066275 RepID=UPI00313AA149
MFLFNFIYYSILIEKQKYLLLCLIFSVHYKVYHRELKQTCGIERCQARTGRAQRNHICLAVFAWLDMNKRRINEKITLYQQTWEVIKTSIQNNIRCLLADSQFC